MHIRWSELWGQYPRGGWGAGRSQKECGFGVLKVNLSLSSATYCSFVVFGRCTKFLRASGSSQMKDAAKCVMYSRHSVGVTTTESPLQSNISNFWNGYFTGKSKRKNRATNTSSPRTLQSLGTPGLLWSFRATCCHPLARNEGLSLGRSLLLKPESIRKHS